MKRDGLTHRQFEIAQLIAEGYRTKQIATRLGISIRAVNDHIDKIVKAWGLSRERDAAVQITRHVAAA